MHNTLVHPWMIHPHTGKLLEAVGVRRNGRPIWPILGASEDDGDDDADGDDGDEGDDAGGDDGDDSDDDDDPDSGKSPEELRAELRALRASKTKLLREKANRAKGGNGKGGGKDGDDDAGKKFTREELDEIAEETKSSTRSELMPAIIRSQSKSILSDLGMTFPKEKAQAAAALSRILKLADTEDLDLNDDGEVEGLEHAFRAVKRDFPQLFKGRRVAAPGNAGGGGRPSNKPKSATELQALHAFGGSDDD
jgi:hypothetical protein